MEREDWRAALVASTIANGNRDPKKHRPFQPVDFMPGTRRPQTPTEQKAMLKALTAGIERKEA